MMTKAPRFLLIGIAGVYNYGCEAIVRGTAAILLHAYPNAEIIYASPRPYDDSERLSGSRLTIINRGNYNRYSIRNITRKLISLSGSSCQPRYDSLHLLKGIDAVFSIGGDIYTPGPSGEYPMSFAKFGDAARELGIPYILWGASVGPFAKYPQAERTLKQHLKKISLITAREKDTIDYLKKLGVGDLVEPCADPAYVVAPDIQAPLHRQGGELTIGINLSPLSSSYSHFSLEDAIHKQARSIEQIVHSTKARIRFIPHVVCGWNEGDDDLRYLRKIKNSISREYTSYVQLLEEDQGFVGAKRELAKCDMVIAARMHCAINALSSQVPTLLVSYSQKSLGMADYIYGHRDWHVEINDFNNTELLLSKVHGMMTQNDSIRSYLAERLPAVRKDAYAPCQRLKNVLATSQNSDNKSNSVNG